MELAKLLNEFYELEINKNKDKNNFDILLKFNYEEDHVFRFSYRCTYYPNNAGEIIGEHTHYFSLDGNYWGAQFTGCNPFPFSPETIETGFKALNFDYDKYKDRLLKEYRLKSKNDSDY